MYDCKIIILLTKHDTQAAHTCNLRQSIGII